MTKLSHYNCFLNSIFSDFTTIQRTNNVVLDREEDKFSAAYGLGLNKAFVEYANYEV